MNTLTLPAAWCREQELAYAKVGQSTDPYEGTPLEVVDTGDDGKVSRWSCGGWVVFKYKGKHYQADYTYGATEVQDEQPWEDDDEVTCPEVAKLAKVIHTWEQCK